MATTTNSILEDWFYSAGRAGDYATMHIWDGDGNADRIFEFNFVGGYLSVSHVKAFMVQTTTRTKVDLTVTFTGTNTVTLSQAVPVGWQVTIYRDTPKDKPLASYTDGAVLNALNLDRNSDQAMFAVSEMVDRFDVVTSTSEEALKVAYSTIDKADTAVATANSASAAATSAVITAGESNAKATQAVNTANSANNTALGIDAKAQRALDNSTAAVSTANTAKDTADGIDAKATKALSDSTDAVSTATMAKSTADSAKDTADGIDAKATKALQSSDTALARSKKRVTLTDFSGVTEEARWVSALGAMASGGELIVPSGTYTFTGTVAAKFSRRVRIRFEGGVSLRQSVDETLFDLQATTQFGGVEWVGSPDIYMSSGVVSSKSTAIRMSGVPGMNNGVYISGGTSILVESGGWFVGLHIEDMDQPRISDVVVSANGASGSTGFRYISRNGHNMGLHVSDCDFMNADTGVLLKGYNNPGLEGASLTNVGCSGVNVAYVIDGRDSGYTAPHYSFLNCHADAYVAAYRAYSVQNLYVTSGLIYVHGDTANLPVILDTVEDAKFIGVTFTTPSTPTTTSDVSVNNSNLTMLGCSFYTGSSRDVVQVASSKVRLIGGLKNTNRAWGCPYTASDVYPADATQRVYRLGESYLMRNDHSIGWVAGAQVPGYLLVGSNVNGSDGGLPYASGTWECLGVVAGGSDVKQARVSLFKYIKE